MLASASDDQYIKIWTLNSGLAHDLHAHSKEVFSLRWSPAGPGSTNPNGTAYLASASFDKTVKIWDPTRGICMHKLVGHQESVYSISFSPDNQILASGGSTDGFCYLWDVRSGNKLGSYKVSYFQFFSSNFGAFLHLIRFLYWNSYRTKYLRS